MISSSTVKYIRVSPRKVREVADLVRGKTLPEAFAILDNLNKRARVHVYQVLKSALHNATSTKQVSADSLFVAKIVVEAGPTMKRHRAEPMGRASIIRKRTSHIRVELDMRQAKLMPVRGE